MMWFLMTWMLVFSPADAKVTGKESCWRRELQRKDCLLTKGSYHIRLSSSSIARDDGTWHMVDEMPLKGDGITWEKARFSFFKDWPILQLWIWDNGQGEAKVQSLHWFVIDARKREIKILADEVVRRRHSSILDKEEKHDLKLSKKGGLQWSLGNRQQTFQPN